MARGLPQAAAAQGDLAALVAQLKQAPLGLAQAVQLALVNNPRVVQGYARIGLAAAEVYDAGRLSNPQFSTAVMTPDARGEVNQVTFGLVQRCSDLLLLPVRRRMAQGEFERVQAETAQSLINLAADTQAAWFKVLGAGTLASQRAEQATAAGIAAALSQRFFEAGNVSARELAEARASASSEQLAAGNFAVEAAKLQGEALAQRLDLASRRQLVGLLERAMTDARRFRYLGEISVGVETERETDRSRITGPSLAIELPLFNQGDGKLVRAAAQLELARSDLRALELEIRRDVQAGAATVNALAARDAEINTTLVPARTAALARTQEEVNYLLESPFGLLRATQLLLEAQQQAVQTRRDYWLARTELARAVGALRPLPPATPADVAAPPPPAAVHEHH